MPFRHARARLSYCLSIIGQDCQEDTPVRERAALEQAFFTPHPLSYLLSAEQTVPNGRIGEPVVSSQSVCRFDMNAAECARRSEQDHRETLYRSESEHNRVISAEEPKFLGRFVEFQSRRSSKIDF